MEDQGEKDLALLVRAHGSKRAAEYVIESVLGAVQASKFEETRLDILHRLAGQLKSPTARYHQWAATQYSHLAFLLGCLDSDQLANEVIGYCASYGCSSSPNVQDLTTFLSQRRVDQGRAESIALGLVGYLAPNFAGLTVAEES